MSYAQKLDDVAALHDQLECLEPSVGATGAPLEIALSAIEEDPDSRVNSSLLRNWPLRFGSEACSNLSASPTSKKTASSLQ